MKKINYVLIFISFTIYSCAHYTYKFNEESYEIIAKKKVGISTVRIDDKKGHLIEFEIKPNKISRKFSLIDFSPDYFQCTLGCDSFEYKKGATYFVVISPIGDIVSPDITIRIDSIGVMRKVKTKEKYYDN